MNRKWNYDHVSEDFYLRQGSEQINKGELFVC